MIQKIEVDSLLYSTFYHLYDEYENLLLKPAIKSQASQTKALDKAAMVEQLQVANDTLTFFEKQAKIEQFDAPRILSAKSRRDAGRAYDIRTMYDDYIEMKYWQDLLTRVVLPQKERVLNHVPSTYGDKLWEVLTLSTKDNTHASAEKIRELIDWNVYYAKLGNLLKEWNIAVDPADRPFA